MIVIASLYLPSTRSKQAGANWQNFAKSRNTAAPSAVPTSAGSKGLSVEDKAKEWTKKNLKPGGELSAKAPAAVVKQGSVSPWDAALRLGLLGAGGGLAFQGLRKLMQSKRDEEEEGSPSLLKGMLLGGLLGAGGGAGIAHLLNRGQAPDSPPEMLGAGHDVAGAAPSATEIPAESLQAQMAQARPSEMRTSPPLGRKSETALQDAGKSSISPQFSAGQATTPQLSLADLANMQSVVGPNGEFKFGEFEAPRTMTGSGSYSVPNAVPMDFPMFHRRRS